MTVSLSEFEGVVKANEKLRRTCIVLGLSDEKCEVLEGRVAEICGELGSVRRSKSKRKLSSWQLCMKECAKGKPFGPETRKECHTKYKQGVCPSPDFVKKYEAGKRV